jgi:ankyrin repeat protein
VAAVGVAPLRAGEPPLVDAVRVGRLDVARALVQQGADVNATDTEGATALHWATHLDDLPAVTFLLDAGADARARTRYGMTPLWLSCINGHPAIVSALLASGADPNTTMAEGDTTLMTAARTGTLAVVQALIAHGADVDAREHWKGQTALMWAAARNNAAVVRVLVQAGADVQARTRYHPPPVARTGGLRLSDRSSDVTREAGFTALLFAVRAGAREAVDALLQAGATVDDTLSDGTSALVVAIASTHYELADMLLERGADPNAARQGWTPLHQVAWTRRPNTGVNNPGLVPRDAMDSLALARRLLARGADPRARVTRDGDVVNLGRHRLTDVGASPFWVAAENLDLPLMRLLAASGADPLMPNATGDTPLLAASGLSIEKPGENPGSPDEVTEAIRLCLELGADPNTVDDNGDTALHGAAMWGSNGAVELLVAAGATLDVKNTRGLTPWRIAEGAVFEDALLAQPRTAALLRRLLEARGLPVE